MQAYVYGYRKFIQDSKNRKLSDINEKVKNLTFMDIKMNSEDEKENSSLKIDE